MVGASPVFGLLKKCVSNAARWLLLVRAGRRCGAWQRATSVKVASGEYSKNDGRHSGGQWSCVIKKAKSEQQGERTSNEEDHGAQPATKKQELLVYTTSKYQYDRRRGPMIVLNKRAPVKQLLVKLTKPMSATASNTATSTLELDRAAQSAAAAPRPRAALRLRPSSEEGLLACGRAAFMHRCTAAPFLLNQPKYKY